MENLPISVPLDQVWCSVCVCLYLIYIFELANEIADYLRRFILALYDDHIAPNGLVSAISKLIIADIRLLLIFLQAVDYVGISRSPKFEEYVKATGELKRVDVSSLTREQKLAFFINIYNALVIHGFVVKGPPTNTWGRLKVSLRILSVDFTYISRGG